MPKPCTPPSARRLVLALAGLAWLGCGFAPGCSDDPAPIPSGGGPTATPPPPASSSPFENTTSNAQHVGTAACQSCHPDQHRTWSHTAHARSLARVVPENEPPDVRFEHRKSGRAYEVTRSDGRLVHRESLLLEDGSQVELSSHPLAYLVGSGRFSRTYLVTLDGLLIESPITWYAQRKAWDMSPGYDHNIHDSFRRQATHDCLLCHAGDVEPDETAGFTFPRGELAIGCERCHGPGSLHVARHRGRQPTGSTDSRDTSIVHPGRLERPLAEAVCQQCHLQGDVKVMVRGRQPGTFRPGLPLSEERIEFRLQGSGPEMTVVGHVDQLRASRCYQQDRELSCVTCHDPHDPHHPREPADRIRHQRQACLGCHAPAACNEEESKRQATTPVADACTTCHMPQVDTDIPHIAFTHHKIAVHQSADRLPRATDEPDLGSIGELTTIQDLDRFDSHEQQRLLGLAYYRLHFQRPWRHTAFLARAERLLRESTRHIRGDQAARAALAEIEWEARRGPAALRHAEAVIATDKADSAARATALHVKVQILMDRNELARAVPLLETLTRLRRHPLDWALLGHCHLETNDARAAITAFQRALEIAPGQGAIHAALSRIYRRTGGDEKARHHAAEARRLPPGGFEPR